MSLCLSLDLFLMKNNFYYKSYMYFLKSKLENFGEQNKINTGNPTTN